MVDCVSFSVIPALTALWARLLLAALSNYDLRILVGDCSGGLRPPRGAEGRLCILRIENEPHGLKLDRFLRDHCRAKHVIVCDDDVFWLNELPLRWSLQHLALHPDTAVVSLAPRDPLGPAIIRALGVEERELRPMGSFCLVLRRDTWLQEGLSFQVVPASDNQHGLAFDTADLAHLELLQRGYAVAIAPEEVRRNLVVFERTSSWILRMQETCGALAPLLEGGTSRPEKALQAAVLARSIAHATRDFLAGRDLPEPVTSKAAGRTRALCRSLLGEEHAKTVETAIQEAFLRVTRRLEEIER